MTSRDGRWTIVFNGEIFNYLELRREMVDVEFRTTTDTEVLLEACARWGVEATLPKLVGMFAFALWDSRSQALALVRDRVGEKPLAYFWDGETLAFASEMKALRSLHKAELEPKAVDAYLALGYVPAPLGIFRNTKKLQAGHLARWQAGTLRVERWWHPESAETALPNHPDNPRVVRGRIAEAVHLRLRSDVPIALALSGGLDSSVIAAELAEEGHRPDAFTVVFDDDETDLPYAQAVARHFHLPLDVIRADAGGIEEMLLDSVAHYDEPFADSSGLPTLALARALQGRYKVILNGDGGDEAFAGYSHYAFIAAKQALKAAAAVAGLCDGSLGRSVYVESKVIFRGQERESLLRNQDTRGALTRFLEHDSFLQVPPDGALKQALWSDRHLYLANDLTYKMDIALSSCGIEGRAPLLDHRILEWAQGLSAPELVQGRKKKVLLRQTYASQLPAKVVSRGKHGFGSPIDRWLEGPLACVAEELLPCPLLQPEQQVGAAGQRQWSLLTFACWARAWGARW
jgi:asparagine synthase (glutamine-hydrolysing)